MAITTLNNRSINRSDTAAAGQKWTATSATASDFQAAGGITEVDQWRITTNYTKTGSGTADITANWERSDTDGFGQIGTGMTESSGIFTFPSTGFYEVHATASMYGYGGGRTYMGFGLMVTLNNSSYSATAQSYDSSYADTYYGSGYCVGIIDVTDTANVKVKMQASVAGDTRFEGDTGQIKTGFTFIRLGDT